MSNGQMSTGKSVYDAQLPEAVDDADEVAVTMRKGDWRVLEEFFCSMPYDDDWTDEGTLKDEQLERIRQKLMAVIQPSK